MLKAISKCFYLPPQRPISCCQHITFGENAKLWKIRNWHWMIKNIICNSFGKKHFIIFKPNHNPIKTAFLYTAGMASLNIDVCVVGALSGCGCRTRKDDRGGAGVQHPSGRQLPGVSAEEELAERPRSLRQEHHGQTPASLLNDRFSVNKKNEDAPSWLILVFLFVVCVPWHMVCQFYGLRHLH